MLTYLITFLAIFVTDIIYVCFVNSIQNNKPLTASFWSAFVTFTASVAVINYTQDNMALIPALLGAFAGTYVGMLVKDRFKNK